MNTENVSDNQSVYYQIKPAGGWQFPDLLELWRLRELLYIMVKSNLSARYRQSAFSALYLFIQPLFSVGIFTFIFSGIAKISTGEIPYPLFSFVGVVSWNFFNRSLNDGNSSLVSMSPILSKIYMPRLMVILVSICVQLFEYLIALSLLSIFFIVFKMAPSANIIFLPIAILSITLFSISIILWLSNLNVRFRDVSVILPGAIQVLFYATPVVYPLTVIPEKWQWLFKLNPMTNILEFVRFCLLPNQNLPDFKYIVINAVTVAVIIFFGLIVFNRYSKTLVDRL